MAVPDGRSCVHVGVSFRSSSIQERQIGFQKEWTSYMRPRLINGKRVASGEYRSWQMMKNRCLNPNAQDYRHYGMRGISVCKRWMSFDAFISDMGPRPTPKHTLERRNGDKNYSPSNCYWATRAEQSRNRAYCRIRGLQRHLIKRMYAGGLTQNEIAMQMGVSQSRVSQIVRDVT